jgi:dimethylhistidine N-methyltransferase
MKPQRIFYQEQHQIRDTLLEDVHSGLSSQPKQLSPKYFYDQRGSQLFDAITQLPEYYPTRTEIGLLRAHADEFAELLGQDSILLELGSGSSTKIRILLEALRPQIYVPMDISKEHLIESAQRLADDYPWLEVHAIRVDYSQPWQAPDFGPGRYNAFFPGSSIGNFDPEQAVTLLRQVATLVGDCGGLLIGVDLKKDRRLLERAYNDCQGITAAFNLNILEHIRQRLTTDLNPAKFRHKAFYNETRGRIEMHLESLSAHEFTVENRTYSIKKGETIHTESSYKYTIDEFHQLAAQAGFVPVRTWTDPEQYFSLHYLQYRPAQS